MSSSYINLPVTANVHAQLFLIHNVPISLASPPFGIVRWHKQHGASSGRPSSGLGQSHPWLVQTPPGSSTAGGLGRWRPTSLYQGWPCPRRIGLLAQPANFAHTCRFLLLKAWDRVNRNHPFLSVSDKRPSFSCGLIVQWRRWRNSFVCKDFSLSSHSAAIVRGKAIGGSGRMQPTGVRTVALGKGIAGNRRDLGLSGRGM
jgi:hypothetical protein